MLTASGAFDVVMGSLVQRVAGQLTLTLPAGPYSDLSLALDSVQLDAQNTTDLPDGVRDTVGFATIGGSVTLAGSVDPHGDGTKTAAWLFNPDEPTSPLYRLKVRGSAVAFTFGVFVAGSATPELLPKLTGRVTSVDCDHAAGTVTLGLVDLTADWDSLPSIPAVVTAPPYNAGLTSEFAIDAVLRAASAGAISSWPAQRPQCVLAVGMRTSVWPEVGRLQPVGGGGTTPPVFGPGVFGSACIQHNDIGGWAFSPITGDTLTTEYWVNNLGGNDVLIDISGSAGDVTVDVTATSVTVTVISGINSGQYVRSGLSIGTGGHYIGVLLSFPSGTSNFTATVRVDSSSTTSGSTAAGFTRNGAYSLANGGGVSIEAWQITTESAPTWNDTFVPQAVLDASLNPLTVVPAIEAGAKTLDVIQQIAAAELGYARRDELGMFRFTNRQTIAAAAIARTVTSTISLKDLKTSQGASTEYNHIQVPFTEWDFGAAGLIFTLGSRKKIGKYATTSWTQPLGDGILAGAITSPATLLPNGHAVTDGGTWYRASTDIHGVGPHPGLTITVTQLSSSTVRIDAANNTGQDAWLTTPATYTDFTAGNPSTGLWIGGIPAVAAAEAFADVTYGPADTLLTVTSNPYIQDQVTATALGQYLLGELSVSIRDFLNVSIVPDARLQITDKLHLQDPNRSKVDEYAYLWGWSFTADFPAPGQTGGSWDETLNLRALGPPGSWLGGIAGRSEGGITTYGY